MLSTLPCLTLIGLIIIFFFPFLIINFLLIEFSFNIAGYSLSLLSKQYLNVFNKYFLVGLSAYTGIVFFFVYKRLLNH